MTVTTWSPALLLEDVQAHARAVGAEAQRREATRLAHELDGAARRSIGPCDVAAVGDRSRGKSTMLNGLLGHAGLLPTEVDVTTNAYIVVAPPGPGWPRAGSARIVFGNGATEGIELTRLSEYASETGNPHNEKDVEQVDVVIDHPLLEEGFRFLDTPGVGGLISAHGSKTREAVRRADGLLMVLDADKPMGQPEIEFISRLADRTARIVLVHNRRGAGGGAAIVEGNRRALERQAPQLSGVPMVVVSARLAERAAEERDEDPGYADELWRESNFGELVELLREHILGGVRRELAAAVLGATADAIEELETPDRELLRATDGEQDATARLDAARGELRALRAHQPGPRLERRLTGARTLAAQGYADGLAALKSEYLARIDVEWSAEMAAGLPEELRTDIDALWGEATNALTHRIAEAAEEVFADYALGAYASGGDGRSAGEHVPERVRSRPATVARASAQWTLDGILRFISVVASGVAAVTGSLAVPHVSLPALAIGKLAEKLGGQNVAAQAAARAFVEERTQAARERFGAAFEDLARGQSDRVIDLLEIRFQARLESLEATVARLEEFERRTATAQDARRRLDDLQPFRARQRELADRLEAGLRLRELEGRSAGIDSR